MVLYLIPQLLIFQRPIFENNSQHCKAKLVFAEFSGIIAAVNLPVLGPTLPGPRNHMSYVGPTTSLWDQQQTLTRVSKLRSTDYKLLPFLYIWISLAKIGLKTFYQCTCEIEVFR